MRISGWIVSNAYSVILRDRVASAQSGGGDQ